MTTQARDVKFAPAQRHISIYISNGAWYDKSSTDVCCCIYAKGKCGKIDLGVNRDPKVIKYGTSAAACCKAYDIIEMLSSDIIAIHKGLGFDLKRIATHSSVY